MNKKYYLVRITNLKDRESWQYMSWDDSPTKALSRALRKIKSKYTAEEYEQSILRCNVNQIMDVDIRKLKQMYNI